MFVAALESCWLQVSPQCPPALLSSSYKLQSPAFCPLIDAIPHLHGWGEQSPLLHPKPCPASLCPMVLHRLMAFLMTTNGEWSQTIQISISGVSQQGKEEWC